MRNTATVPVPNTATVPVPNTATVPVPNTATVPVPNTATVPVPVSSGVLEWSLAESQSDIQGRTGSNACVFIALNMGKLCFNKKIPWPNGNILPEPWRAALREAMIKGNQIHDDLLDHEGVNVTIDEAVSLAGEECGVRALGPQLDIFGYSSVNQVANVLIQEANNSTRAFIVIVCHERAFLFVLNSDQSAMLIDSHCHGNTGAIIACSARGNILSLATWLDAMMRASWNCLLTIASMTKIIY